MPSTTRALLLFSFLCGACATHIAAGRPLDAAGAAEIQSELDNARGTVHLDPGAKEATIELTRLEINPEALQGMGREGPRTIPIESVRSITWRSGWVGFARGAVAGVFLGPLLGGAIGGLIPPSSQDQDTIIHPFQGAIYGLLLGPLLFGAIGALIGVENRIDF
jgi:hypothetical protein